jgi:hypothetical protein
MKNKKPNIQIDDLVREMTDEEFEVYKANQAAQVSEAEAFAAAKAKADADKAALLARLGLTEDELKTILG